MRVRSLKRLVGSYGLLRKGDEIDLPNYLANELIALGYVEVAVEALDDAVDAQEAPQPKRRGRKNASR